MNIKPDGTIPSNPDEGLNPNPARNSQIYSILLQVTMGAEPAKFIRLTKLPVPSVLALIQPLPSNTVERIAFNLALTEVGTGNGDGFSESYYLLSPGIINRSKFQLSRRQRILFRLRCADGHAPATPTLRRPKPDSNPTPSRLHNPPSVHGTHRICDFNIMPALLTVVAVRR